MDMRLCVRQDPHLTAYIRLCLCVSLPVLSVTLRVPVDDCALSLWIPSLEQLTGNQVFLFLVKVYSSLEIVWLAFFMVSGGRDSSESL